MCCVCNRFALFPASILVQLRSIDLDTLQPELRLCNVDLSHQFRVRLRHIIERHNIVSKLEEEKRAKGDNGPERELYCISFDIQDLSGSFADDAQLE